MEPLVSLTILNSAKNLPPGEILRWEFQIDAVQPKELQAVETSVMWYSDGKGEPEIGVHLFSRDVRADFPDGDLCCLRKFETKLPNSPLSYDGTLIKIQWCIRVRVFLDNAKPYLHDQPFNLGDYVVPAVQSMVLQTA